LSDSNNGKSGYQSVGRTPHGNCAEPRRGHWYGTGTSAEHGRDRGRPMSLFTPGGGATHSTTNKDLADSDNGESGYQSPDRTPTGNGVEPYGGHWYRLPAGCSRGGDWPGRLNTAGRGATHSTINKDLASSTEDDGNDNSTGSQGSEDNNDLGSCGDGAALRGLEEAVL
jgi:hypothetical protein